MFAPSSAQLAKQSPILPYPKSVYSFWTGNNEITGTRKKNIKRNASHLRHLGITFYLVTPGNLKRFREHDWSSFARRIQAFVSDS